VKDLFSCVTVCQQVLLIERYMSQPSIKAERPKTTFVIATERLQSLSEFQRLSQQDPDFCRMLKSTTNSLLEVFALKADHTQNDVKLSSIEILTALGKTHPAVTFCLQYALAKLALAKGLSPSAIIGVADGVGVAACIADVISLKEAFELLKFKELAQFRTGFDSDEQLTAVLLNARIARVPVATGSDEVLITDGKTILTRWLNFDGPSYFYSAISEVLKEEEMALIEISVGDVLTRAAKSHKCSRDRVVKSLFDYVKNEQVLLD